MVDNTFQIEYLFKCLEEENCCVIQKRVYNADIIQRMKLTRNKLLELIRGLNNGWTVYKASKIARISVGYTYRLWNQYKQTGELPEIGKCLGRPIKEIPADEERIVKEAYKRYRVCASRLHFLIEKDYKIRIPVYSIHRILLKFGYAKSNGRNDVRKKKWIRYERRHSLTAVHVDWYYSDQNRIWVLPVLDDSSRKLLALNEVESATTDASINAMTEALKHGEIQQCISDHGTQFIKGEDDKARFPAFLKEHRIKQILCRIKHPQSNGKLEKFNDLYRRHRHAFKTKRKFMDWYNNIRPHLSLDEKTPEQAYQERKKGGRKYYT